MQHKVIFIHVRVMNFLDNMMAVENLNKNKRVCTIIIPELSFGWLIYDCYHRTDVLMVTGLEQD